MVKQVNDLFSILVECHGYVHSDFMKIKQMLTVGLKKEMTERDFGNLRFQEVISKIVDTQGVDRPYIRLKACDTKLCDLATKVLGSHNWEGFVEYARPVAYKKILKKR